MSHDVPSGLATRPEIIRVEDLPEPLQRTDAMRSYGRGATAKSSSTAIRASGRTLTVPANG
ncbi:MAG: hypothetical protein QOG25_2232 [Acetobacteraceae bacterium]|nr:hypothetical protein [Acetobacteraceae bacterium]